MIGLFFALLESTALFVIKLAPLFILLAVRLTFKIGLYLARWHSRRSTPSTVPHRFRGEGNDQRS